MIDFINNMQTQNTDHFYTRLPSNNIALSDLLTEDHLFYAVPSNWHVIITDIKNSTSAVENNQHETVNLIATGSIVAVLNIAHRLDILVPFFFGGDGATFIVPETVMHLAINALLMHSENTMSNFNLTLRVGTVPVKDLYNQSHELKIAKFKSSDIFSIPVLLGDGLEYAEKQIKGENYERPTLFFPIDELDLAGMQCRWDKIDPPQTDQEVVTLLVLAGSGYRQSEVFKKVILHLDKIYGVPEKRQPISISKLKLKSTFTRLGMEVKTRLGNIDLIDQFRTWLTCLLGYLYFRTTKGKKYLTKLVSMSDTLVIDGKINTVIAGTAAQRIVLEMALNSLEQLGEISYGLCVSKEAVMSCYVRDLDDSHVHFVDGSEGGYTRAAGTLKLKTR